MYTKEQMESKDAYYQGVIANLHETLRDRFAMAALTGLVFGRKDLIGNFTKEAYLIADAMMDQRDLRRDSGQSD